MRIDLTDLLRAVGNEAEIERTEEVSFAEDGLLLAGPVKVQLHLVNAGYSVLLKGTLESVAELECSRCLKKMRQALKVAVSEEYGRPAPGPKAKMTELKEEDFICPLGEGNLLDLTELIRENLLLALPIKPLCREACKGE
jgi:uncharacterized protein